MPKIRTRSNSVKPQYGGGVRGRDAEFPSAPLHVTDDAQAKVIDPNTARHFEFSQMERNKLPERPSTSGGPAKISVQRNAEKREAKDDLHFNPRGAHGSGTTFYNFPLPGSLPTPINTPSSSPPVRTSSLPRRSDTHKSMDYPTTNLSVPPLEIGMALGSPTHQPNNWQSPSPFESSTRNETPDSVETYVENEMSVAAPYRQKASKWKIFGGLFGGSKKNGSPQTFYQLRPEGTLVQTTVESGYVDFGEPSSIEPRPSKPRGRGRTNSQRKGEKGKPGMRRAQTAPLNFELGDASRGRTQATPRITLDGGPLSVHIGTKHGHGGPLLDVDIPSIHMERYSVMFGSLLQKPTGTSSSLLARRQATLDRLKTANEELALKQQELEEKSKQIRSRRATSPQPTQSPAFSLFPSTPSQLTVRDGSPSPNRRNHLQRSNTSPAALSPSRPTFAPGPDNETHATLMGPGPHVPVVAEPEVLIFPKPKVTKQASEPPPKPQSTTHNWSPEKSQLTLDSPSSDVEEDIYDPASFPMNPKLDSPTWQMVIPQHVLAPSVSGSTSSSSDHSTSTSASSISTTSVAPFTNKNTKTVKLQPPPTKLGSRSGTATIITAVQSRRKNSETSITASSGPSSQSIPVSKLALLSIPKKTLATVNTHQPNALDEKEARLKSAADVSIARQISVSRQQRQLLIPIKASSTSNLKAPTNKYNQNFTSPLNVNRVASPLAVVACAARGEPPVPLDRNGNESGRERVRGEKKKGTMNERLAAASVKPAMPTLVVVGSGGEGEKWSGRAVESPITGSGEIRIGLGVAVGGGGRNGSGNGSGLSLGEVYGHQHRKSERVVVERISVAES